MSGRRGRVMGSPIAGGVMIRHGCSGFDIALIGKDTKF